MNTTNSLNLTFANPQTSPLITIIVAVYNNASTLQRCIDSVASQSYLHKELVIIDGGSTDGTVELIKQNSDKITSWVSEPDKGIYNAFNKGLERAKGDWIYFLGSDDYLWNNEVLSLVTEQLQKIDGQKTKLVYGKVAIVSLQEEFLEVVNDKSWSKIKQSFLLEGGGAISHQGVFHHRSLFEVYGKFDESFLNSGDYDVMLRELKISAPIFLPDIIIAGRRVGGVSLSFLSKPNWNWVVFEEDHRARVNNKILDSFSLQWLILYNWYRGLKLIRILVIVVLHKIDVKFLAYITDIYRRVVKGKPPTWTKGQLEVYYNQNK